MRFSYYKTANRTAPCGVVRCGAVMPFCRQFWCGFCDLCGLCGLVNTPTCKCDRINHDVFELVLDVTRTYNIYHLNYVRWM